MLMKTRFAFGGAVAACLVLAGCGDSDAPADDDAMVANDVSAVDTPQTEALTMADGAGVCFKAVEEALGADVKIAEVMTNFSVGEAIESRDTEPVGTVTSCSVQYQDPADPRKLLERNMAATPGTFSEPNPVEITVSGDAASFDIEDMLVPLNQVNYAALDGTLKSLTSKLDGAYAPHAWNFIRFSGPDAFNDVHVFRVGLKGRLKTNDIQDDGQVVIAKDGKTIVDDRLIG